MSTFKVVEINWEEIKNIWDTELWPGRDTKQTGLYVNPSFRKKGISQLLLKASIDWARERDCSKYLFTAPRKQAIPAYESAGFIIQGKLFEATRSSDNFIAALTL